MREVLARRGLLVESRYTQPLERLSGLPFTDGNSATLLVDGAATFESIFDGIAAARHYVLVQFYIVRDDGLGRELRERLLERAAAGVRVHLLYDEIGSYGLPRDLRRRAAGRRRRGAGVQPRPRRTTGCTSTSATTARSSWWTDGAPGSAASTSATNTWGATRASGRWRDTHV